MIATEEFELPIDVHAEVAILGAMLLEPLAVSDGISKLNAGDFATDAHQRIFRAIAALDRAASPSTTSPCASTCLVRRNWMRSEGLPT